MFVWHVQCWDGYEETHTRFISDKHTLKEVSEWAQKNLYSVTPFDKYVADEKEHFEEQNPDKTFDIIKASQISYEDTGGYDSDIRLFNFIPDITVKKVEIECL